MSQPLWTADEAARAMGGTPVGEVAAVGGVSIDTRTLQPGDLFFAIQGEARDGHDFVADALAQGAAACVVQADRAPAFQGPLIAVGDVLAAMVALGRAARRRSGARIVAVTGSVGKTGTKEALRLALGRLGPTHASAASYNNHWGVPLTLARMPRDAAFGVFEIGMNHGGEIAPLTRMVRPHAALVTTVEPVHIEHFRSVHAIADAKGEVFAGLEPGGVAVLNRDIATYERLRAHAGASPAGRVLTFGEHEAADIRLERIALGADGSMVSARVLGRPLAYRVGMPGRHVAMNSLGIVAVAHGLGLDVAEVARALADLTPPQGRGARTTLHRGGAFLLVDESYNANPASMRAALATLAQVEPGPGGRRIAVLGDMLELGPEGPAMHAGLAEAVEANGIDQVFAAGPLMHGLWSALPRRLRGGYGESAAALEPALLAAVQAGDVVVVKGSNGSRMGRLVAALKARYGADAPDEGVRGTTARC